MPTAIPTPTLSDIQAAFAPADFSRGQEYFSRGKVLAMEFPEDNRVEAVVQGTRRVPYRVALHLLQHGKRVRISGFCSCPVGFNCKHAVAAALALANRKPTESLSHEHWFRALESASALASSGYPGTVKERVLYLLDLGEVGRGVPIVELRMVVARLLKDGRYGRERRHSTWSTARCVLLEDQAIGHQLDAFNWSAYNSRLEGEWGSRLLRQILETGRAHWQDANTPPLRLGPSRHAQLDWQPDATGVPHLRLVAEGEPQLLPLAPPWYLDLESRESGPLTTAFPPAVAAQWVTAPPLVPKDLPRLKQTLDRAGIDAVIEPPPNLRREEVRETAVACLELSSLYVESRSGWTDVARLSFAYGEHRLVAEPGAKQTTLVKDGVMLVVNRDAAFEQQALRRLGTTGLYLLDESGNRELYVGDEHNPDASWLDFIETSLPELRREGWHITEKANFTYRLVEADQWYADLNEGSDWFSLGLDVEVDGARIPLMPLLVEVIRGLPELFRGDALDGLADDATLLAPLPDGRRLKLPARRIKPMLATLLELFDPNALDAAGRLRLPRLQASLLPDMAPDLPLQWQGGEALRNFGERLRNFREVADVAPPAGLLAELRPYQREGLAWLQFLRDYDLAGILADDMGLGKTVQTVAHVLTEKEAGRLDRPALVIAPTSLVANWAHETARFAPGLRVLVLHGAQRHEQFAALQDHDLVITTYPLLARDRAALLAHSFHLLVLDEAQIIKNARSQAAQVAREIPARHKLCLTGTPMENHLGELWSLFHFLMPGLLGDEATFRRLFRNPIEKQGDELRRAGLARRIAPFLLRRTKAQVVTELPPKTEIIRNVTLSGRQRDLYEAVRAAMDAKVRQEIEKKGVERSQIIILDALLKLRQVCCDPRLLKLDSARRVKESAKLELLLQMLPELIEEGRSILLFSQFTSMLALVEEALAPLGIDYVKLTGQTRDRATPVRRFQNGEVPLFLISLKAGGVGLNLTAADTVIHYDPWWNPAVENQATDRAHRIGQERPVFVYKLIAEGTVEEKIAELQTHKRDLAEALLAEGGKKGVRLSQDDLGRLFEPLD